MPKCDVRSEKMGFFGALSYVIGNIVGSGIFITPTSILTKVNSVGLSLVIWVASALISLLAALCYIELGTSIRASGSDFTYMCFMKWYPLAFGFMCVSFTVSYPGALAIQSQAFAEYLFKAFNVEMDKSSAFWAKKLLAFSLMWLLMFINFFSLRTYVSKFQMVASIAKIGALLLVIGTGFYYIIFQGATENLSSPFDGASFAPGSFVAALLAGMYSYDGYTILNTGIGEIRRPGRNMPLAVIVGLLLITVLYVCVNVSYFAILTVPEIIESHAVAISFASRTLGAFSVAMPILVALLLVGSVNSMLFNASRYLQAVAKAGHLPTAFSALHPCSNSPRVAVFIIVILAMAMSFLGSLNELIQYCSFAHWIKVIFSTVALLWIRIRHIQVHPERIKMPLVIPIIQFGICLAIIVLTMMNDIKNAAIGIGILMVGIVIFYVFVFEKSLPSVNAYHRVSRQINDRSTIFAQIVFNVMPERVDDNDFSEAIGIGKEDSSSTSSTTTSDVSDK